MTTLTESLNAATQELRENAAQYFAMRDAIRAELNAKKAEVDAALAAAVRTGAPTINVGPTRTVTTLGAAWAALRGRVLTGPVTIQLDDGEHAIAGGVIFDAQPFADLVSVRGNLANPENCVLRFTAPVAGAPYGLSVRGVSLKLGGVRLTSATGAGSTLYCSQGYVYCEPGSVIVDNADTGVVAVRGGMVEASGLRATNVGTAASANFSTVWADNAIVAGRGAAAGSRLAAGFSALGNGVVVARGAKATFFRNGCVAQQGGMIDFGSGLAEDCGVGVLGEVGGVVSCPWEAGLTRAIARRCATGFKADTGSVFFVPAARTEDGARGFWADGRSFIHANGAGASNATEYGCFADAMASIDARATLANMAANAAKYNLANAVAGPSGAMILSS